MSIPNPKPNTPSKIVKLVGKVARKTPNPTSWSVIEDQNGNLSGSVEYQYDYVFGQGVGELYLPQRGEPHPYDYRLFAVEIQAKYGQNQLCIVSVNYAGISGNVSTGGSTSDLTWELSCPTSDEPIDTHPNFFGMGTVTGVPAVLYQGQDWSDAANVYKPAPNDGLVFWNLSNVEVDNNQHFQSFKNNRTNRKARLTGVRAYKKPGATLRVNFTALDTSRYDWILENLGKRYEKIPLAEVQNDLPSSAATGQDWLMTSASVQKANRTYKYQVEFMQSGRFGWNQYIYQLGTRR
jgi:hypothetical protein